MTHPFLPSSQTPIVSTDSLLFLTTTPIRSRHYICHRGAGTLGGVLWWPTGETLVIQWVSISRTLASVHSVHVPVHWLSALDTGLAGILLQLVHWYRRAYRISIGPSDRRRYRGPQKGVFLEMNRSVAGGRRTVVVVGNEFMLQGRLPRKSHTPFDSVSEFSHI